MKKKTNPKTPTVKIESAPWHPISNKPGTQKTKILDAFFMFRRNTYYERKIINSVVDFFLRAFANSSWFLKSKFSLTSVLFIACLYTLVIHENESQAPAFGQYKKIGFDPQFNQTFKTYFSVFNDLYYNKKW